LAREAFFLGFAKETREKFPNLVLMLVGGFRSRTGAEPMVESFASDPVGLSYPGDLIVDTIPTAVIG